MVTSSRKAAQRVRRALRSVCDVHGGLQEEIWELQGEKHLTPKL